MSEMLFFFIRKPLLASLTKAKMMQRSPNEIEHCNLLSTFPNPTLTQTGAKGFRMKIELCLITNTIKGLFAEDPIHCVKKFCCKVIVIAPIVFACMFVSTIIITHVLLHIYSSTQPRCWRWASLRAFTDTCSTFTTLTQVYKVSSAANKVEATPLAYGERTCTNKTGKILWRASDAPATK